MEIVSIAITSTEEMLNSAQTWFENVEFSTVMIIEIASIPFLLVLSGLFSASETAITGASRARIHQKAGLIHGRADMAEWLIERREQLIAAILLGNNLVNILASVLATAIFLDFFGEAGIAYATIIMTILIVMFSELLPKTLALIRPDSALLFLAHFAKMTLLTFGTLGLGAQVAIAKLVAPMRQRAENEDSSEAAREELRGAIDLHHIEGAVVKDDKDMLDSILDLDEVDIAHVMIHRTQIVMANADLPTRALIQEILYGAHTRIPLWRGHQENIIGILHTKDVLSAVIEAGGDFDAVKLSNCVRDPWFVLHKTSLRAQLNAFLQGKNHCALVVDEYGELMGFVTLEDILEEIVGEIEDEHDISREVLQKNRDGSVVVDGAIPIRALNRALSWKLPDNPDTSTLAGLVIKEAGEIPNRGDDFNLHGVHVDIVARDGQKITRMKLKKLS